MENRTILVTGSSGMIGTALIERLLENGCNVIGVDKTANRWNTEIDERTIEMDLLEDDLSERVSADVDTVVHLAANARVHNLVKQPHRARDNFEMTFNVLEFIRKQDVEEILVGSSREVYGNTGKIIYSEEDTYVDECESPYTASKVASEAMTDAYKRCYGLDTVVLRFSNVYGRYDVSDRVLPLFIAQAYNNIDLTVYGEEKVLDFTHIDDCVTGIHETIRNFNKAKGTTFNIASGEGASLLELAEKIQATATTSSEIHVESNRTGEVGRYIADIDKARKVFGYEPEYGFDEGLEQAIDWYTSRPELLDEILEQVT
jgi:nucleoside-diphosphate-sugar epimerase